MKLQYIANKGRKWLSETPERALDAAYRAAVKIKTIEDNHFQGQKVASETFGYSPSVFKVFRDDVRNYLKTIKIRLVEFKASRSLLIFSDNRVFTEIAVTSHGEKIVTQKQLSAIDKLKYIDAIVEKYNRVEVEEIVIDREDAPGNSPFETKLLLKSTETPLPSRIPQAYRRKAQGNNQIVKSQQSKRNVNTETISNKTGVLPRSFMRTINRIRQEIDPQAENTEEEVLKKFRRSRNKTVISIYFLLILIIVPLFTHQVTKTFLISPLVERYFANHQQVLFVNQDLEAEALMELHRYEENLHFKSLIGFAK